VVNLLREVAGIEILSLVDNSIDLLSSVGREEVKPLRIWIRERMGEGWFKRHFRYPIAEHGFSVLVRVFIGENFHSVLFDTGVSRKGVVLNARSMGVDLKQVEAIALSHGHYDHFGGLAEAVRVIGKEDLTIVVHEDMFRKRGVADSRGTVREYPLFPTEDEVKPAKFIKTKAPHLLADGTILVTGEIPRQTDFEKGYPKQRFFLDGKWLPEPLVWDDRALVVKVKGKGLVIVSGCAHAGIINTILHAQQVTKVHDVCAVLGGFHLAGKEFEPRISETVKMLKQLNPALIVPSHCTGWRGAFAIAKAMPHAFAWNSVGNLYQL
jgi:7,8-dihydropterin-6-yl-methyl-4-(beta-D-ribofuranosyl)aminobenzene 5'-phosphate synthase